MFAFYRDRLNISVFKAVVYQLQSLTSILGVYLRQISQKIILSHLSESDILVHEHQVAQFAGGDIDGELVIVFGTLRTPSQFHLNIVALFEKIVDIVLLRRLICRKFRARIHDLAVCNGHRLLISAVFVE